MNTLTLYEQYEKQSRTVHNRRCIDGRITGSNKCVGYCEYIEHSGFLTLEQRKQHRCIEKGCFYYINKERKLNRDSAKKYDNAEVIVSKANDCIKEYEGLRVLQAIPDECGGWVIRYITITNDYPINKIKERISEKVGFVVKMERLNYDFDICVKLLLAV